jgi:tetratricopeptide (TPR) repeat protein
MSFRTRRFAATAASTLAALATALAVLPVPYARADDPGAEASLREARDRFLAAEKDEDAGRWADALEKLQRVAQVKRTPGVRYHTALCEEHLGRLLAAIDDYKDAAAQARAEGAADVLKLVDRRVADAADRLPHLVVVLVPDLPDAAVRLDGQAIRAGVPVATDPGSHTLDAEAPDRWPSTEVVTLAERDARSFEIHLDRIASTPASTPAPAAPPLATASAGASRERTVAIVAGAATAALLAVGVGAYVEAGARRADAVSECATRFGGDADDACGPLKGTVRAWDWVAVGAWTGAAAAGALAVVSFARSRPAPRVVIGAGSLGVEGSF